MVTHRGPGLLQPSRRGTVNREMGRVPFGKHSAPCLLILSFILTNAVVLVLTRASSELRQHSDKHKLPVCADKWLKRRQMMHAFRLPRSRIHSETKRGESMKITESRVNRNAAARCCHIWTRNHNICLVPTWILWLCQIEALECIKPFLFLMAAAFRGTHHDVFPQRIFPHSFHRSLLF